MSMTKADILYNCIGELTDKYITDTQSADYAEAYRMLSELHGIAEAPQSEWISINVEPKLHQRVITRTKDHDLNPVVGMAIYNGPKVGYLVNGGNRDKGVTHWMPDPPLTVGPTPPSKKDNK